MSKTLRIIELAEQLSDGEEISFSVLFSNLPRNVGVIELSVHTWNYSDITSTVYFRWVDDYDADDILMYLEQINAYGFRDLEVAA